MTTATSIQNSETAQHVVAQEPMRQGAFVEAPHPLLGEPWVSAGEACLEQELPMQVWIRGDEPYAGQFSMDADEVMELLGIKRSRLTQISGRELRVGRARRNRHVRPVYRPEDVHRYKDWSRATATAAKSSAAIDLAAAKLDAVAGALPTELEDRLRRGLDLLQQELRERLSSGLSFLRADLGESVATLRQHLLQSGQSAHLQTLSMLEALTMGQRESHQKLLELMAEMREKQSTLAALVLETRQLATAAVAMAQATQVSLASDLPQAINTLFKDAGEELLKTKLQSPPAKGRPRRINVKPRKDQDLVSKRPKPRYTKPKHTKLKRGLL